MENCSSKNLISQFLSAAPVMWDILVTGGREESDRDRQMYNGWLKLNTGYINTSDL